MIGGVVSNSQGKGKIGSRVNILAEAIGGMGRV